MISHLSAIGNESGTEMCFEDFHALLVQAITRCMDTYAKAGITLSVCDVNLRHAIERELYFKFVSQLDYFYGQFCAGMEIDTENYLLAESYRCLQGRDIELQRSFLDRSFPDNRTERVELLLHTFKPVAGRMLFHLVSPRFLPYLQALRPKLDCELHILCKDGNDELLQAVMASGVAYSVVKVESGEASIGGPMARTMSVRCFSSMLEIVHAVQPETIVNVEGCHVEDQVLCELAKRLGLRSMCIQHGYAHFYPLTVRNMGYQKFLAWGEYFTEGLRSFNSDCSFCNVGNFQLPDAPSSESRQADNEPTGVTIGFLLQGVKYYIRQSDFDAFIELICQAARSGNDMRCYVREHPASPISAANRRRITEAGAVFLNGDSCSAGAFLSRCSVVCSISASTLVEALGVGVIPLYVNLPGIHAFDRLQQHNPAVLMATSVSQAFSTLRKLVEDKSYYGSLRMAMKKQKKYMFAASGERALDNIAKEIQT